MKLFHLHAPSMLNAIFQFQDPITSLFDPLIQLLQNFYEDQMQQQRLRFHDLQKYATFSQYLYPKA